MTHLKIFLMATIFLIGPCVLLGQDSNDDNWGSLNAKAREGNIQITKKFGYYDQFPHSIVNKPIKTFKVFELKANITGPSCQNPGFIFDFEKTTADYIDAREFMEENLRTIILASALAGMEALWPEYADDLKYFNEMAHLKLELESFNCDSAMDSIRDSGIMANRLPYSSCREEYIQDGWSPDQAEKKCKGKLKDVTNFFRQTGVKVFKLFHESLEYAKDLQKNGDYAIPDKAVIDKDYKNILGEIEITTDGHHTKPGSIPFSNFLANRFLEIKKAMTDLVKLCVEKSFKSDIGIRCSITKGDIEKHPVLKYKFHDSKKDEYFVGGVLIRDIANISDYEEKDDEARLFTKNTLGVIDEFANNATLRIGDDMIYVWEHVVNQIKNRNQAESYVKFFDHSIDHLKTELEAYTVKRERNNQQLNTREKLFKSLSDKFLLKAGK